MRGVIPCAFCGGEVAWDGIPMAGPEAHCPFCYAPRDRAFVEPRAQPEPSSDSVDVVDLEVSHPFDVASFVLVIIVLLIAVLFASAILPVLVNFLAAIPEAAPLSPVLDAVFFLTILLLPLVIFARYLTRRDY